MSRLICANLFKVCRIRRANFAIQNNKPYSSFSVNDGLNLASCGLQSSSKSYIIGGTDAAPGAWPWQAALFKDHNFNCGGSLIDPSWVLTAAHCINTITSDPSKLLIAVGVNNIKLAESNRQVIEIKQLLSIKK